MKLRDSLLKVLIVTLTLVIILLWLGFFVPFELHGVLFYVVGRAHACSFAESIDAGRQTALQELIHQAHEQSAKRIKQADDGTELWSTEQGTWWFPSGSGNAFFVALAEQQRDVYRIGQGAIQAGDVVLDCGANIGLFAAEALRMGAARVIAIEPAPNNLAALRKNLADEIKAGRVTVLTKGVWDKEDVLPMFLDPENAAANSFVTDIGSGISVDLELTTIDLIVEDLGLERVDFIKLDIEGSEKQALAGAEQTIRIHRPDIALCLYHLENDYDILPAKVFDIESSYSLDLACLIAYRQVAPQIGHFSAR